MSLRISLPGEHHAPPRARDTPTDRRFRSCSWCRSWAEANVGCRRPTRSSAVSGREACATHARSRAGNSLGRSPSGTTPEPTGPIHRRTPAGARHPARFRRTAGGSWEGQSVWPRAALAAVESFVHDSLAGSSVERPFSHPLPWRSSRFLRVLGDIANKGSLVLGLQTDILHLRKEPLSYDTPTSTSKPSPARPVAPHARPPCNGRPASTPEPSRTRSLRRASLESSVPRVARDRGLPARRP